MVKISVIMPVYNVENYLEGSIDSVLAQDFTDFELIAVNDGSTDSSGAILENYAKKDKRIKIVNKQNGGLSSARNAGIKVMKGEYVYFIDSDDTMHSKALSFLYESAITSNSQVVTARFIEVSEGAGQDMSLSFHPALVNTIIMNSSDAIAEALYEGSLTLHAWGKLIYHEIMRGINFPDGMIFEDAGTTYKILSKAKNIAVTDAELYFYLQRNGSISNAQFSPSRMDHLQFAEDMLFFMTMHHKVAVRAAKYYLFMTSFFIYAKLIDEKLESEYDEAFHRCVNRIVSLSNEVKSDPRARTDIKKYAFTASFNITFLTRILRLKRNIKHVLRYLKRK